MEPPLVQYVATKDGHNLAYTDGGRGQTVVFLPLGLNHVQLSWLYERRITGWLELLAERYRLIRYDSRGQGLSTRGLGPSHSMDAYSLDLETILHELKLKNVILLGYFFSAHVAIRYAAEHPENVRALILVSATVSMSDWPMAVYLGLAQQNWQIFLRNWIPGGLSPEEIEVYVRYFQQTSTPEDFAFAARAFSVSEISGLAPEVAVPTLVIHPRDLVWLTSDQVTKLAALIPHSRLVLIDGKDPFGDPAQGVYAIERFLADVASSDESAPSSQRNVALPLSGRQLEVLRLIAEGKTNKEIAEALVLSLRTVERHVTDLYSRLDVRNRAEATAYILNILNRA